MKSVAIVYAAAAVLLAPAPPAAAAHGAAGHGWAGHFRFNNGLHAGWPRGANRGYWPFYGGGIVAVPPYADGSVVNVAPPDVVYVAVPPRALSCHRSRETLTVPAEAGGTQKITVTRC